MTGKQQQQHKERPLKRVTIAYKRDAEEHSRLQKAKMKMRYENTMGLILGDENIRFWQSQRTTGPLHHFLVPTARVALEGRLR